jgi:hypothetical protein
VVAIIDAPVVTISVIGRLPPLRGLVPYSTSAPWCSASH